MKKRIAIFVLLIVFALTTTVIAVSGCGGSSASGASGPAAVGAAVKNGPIVFRGGAGWGLGNGIWAWKDGWKGLRHITEDPSDADPQGSPGGRWIAFSRRVTTPLPAGGSIEAMNIFRARTDGSQVLQVTSGPHYFGTPSFSATGKRIFFAGGEPHPGKPHVPTGSHIYSVNLDGTGLQKLTSEHYDQDPVPSPNGKIIAFVREATYHSNHIFTMRIDGSHPHDATPRLNGFPFDPAFSPNGRRIAYVRGVNNRTHDIFTMSWDGSDQRRLTGHRGHPVGNVSSPSWSPDGIRLVFARWSNPRSVSSKLRIIRLRDRKLLQTLGGPKFPETPSMFTPAWLRG